MFNGRQNSFAYSVVGIAVLLAGFGVTFAIRLNPALPSLDIRVSIANKNVSDSLRDAVGRFVIDKPDWHTRVIVKSRFPSSSVHLLKDCDVFDVLLLTQKKGLWAAFNRSVFDRRLEVWEGFQSRIVVINSLSGRSWVNCYEDLKGIAEFLSENQIHVDSASDVDDVWDVLTAFRCYRGTDRRYRQLETNSWELTIRANTVLILTTNDKGVVTTAEIRTTTTNTSDVP